jgi:hypothetical protein
MQEYSKGAESWLCMHQGHRKVVTTFRPSKRETALELDPRKALLEMSDLEQDADQAKPSRREGRGCLCTWLGFQFSP